MEHPSAGSLQPGVQRPFGLVRQAAHCPLRPMAKSAAASGRHGSYRGGSNLDGQYAAGSKSSGRHGRRPGQAAQSRDGLWEKPPGSNLCGRHLRHQPGMRWKDHRHRPRYPHRHGLCGTAHCLLSAAIPKANAPPGGTAGGSGRWRRTGTGESIWLNHTSLLIYRMIGEVHMAVFNSIGLFVKCIICFYSFYFQIAAKYKAVTRDSV